MFSWFKKQQITKEELEIQIKELDIDIEEARQNYNMYLDLCKPKIYLFHSEEDELISLRKTLESLKAKKQKLELKMDRYSSG